VTGFNDLDPLDIERSGGHGLRIEHVQKSYFRMSRARRQISRP
jgi:hypothetical protein